MIVENSPLVAIQCITYNHEPYIRQCLEGFVMQKTSFPFIAIVHDDASTDNTTAIIREFEEKHPDIIKPIYETENQYSKQDGSLDRIMNAAVPEGTKYIALCEGDDYWIDENKLQMQVDFLEANPEYGMCYTAARQWNQAKEEFNEKNIGDYSSGFFDLLFNGNKIPTLTVVIRKNHREQYYKEIEPYKHHWLMGDYPLWLYISHNSKAHFFPQTTSVYRHLSESASHFLGLSKTIEFDSSRDDIRNYFLKKYTTTKYDFHAETAWKYAHKNIYSRKYVVNEFEKADFLTKKDKLKYFVARIPILFSIFRFNLIFIPTMKSFVKKIPILGRFLLFVKHKIIRIFG